MQVMDASVIKEDRRLTISQVVFYFLGVSEYIKIYLIVSV